MFIRFNNSTNIWEYDTSAGQTGVGPWLILPNVPFLNKNNVFTDNQSIVKTNPILTLTDPSQAVDSRVARIQVSGILLFQLSNDALTTSQNMLWLSRDGITHTLGPISERNRSIPIGEWIDVPYDSANFSTSNVAMVWTVEAGDQITYAYTLIGKTMFMNITLYATAISGTRDTYLRVKIPGGFLPNKISECIGFGLDNGVNISIRIRVNAGANFIDFYRVDGASWALSPNATYLICQVFFPVQ